MDFEIPPDLRYRESHEWVRVEGTDAPTDADDGDTATVGITDFAQDELGDIVFVELPEVGDSVAAGESFGVVESIKAVSDLYAPVSGEVLDRNEDLFDAPELVNEDPFGDGWMLRVEVADAGELEDLLSAEEYEAQVE